MLADQIKSNWLNQYSTQTWQKYLLLYYYNIVNKQYTVRKENQLFGYFGYLGEITDYTLWYYLIDLIFGTIKGAVYDIQKMLVNNGTCVR